MRCANTATAVYDYGKMGIWECGTGYVILRAIFMENLTVSSYHKLVSFCPRPRTFLNPFHGGERVAQQRPSCQGPYQEPSSSTQFNVHGFVSRYFYSTNNGRIGKSGVTSLKTWHISWKTFLIRLSAASAASAAPTDGFSKCHKGFMKS